MKRFIAFVLAAILIMSTCACGNNKSASTFDNQAESFTKDTPEDTSKDTPLETKLDGIWLYTDDLYEQLEDHDCIEYDFTALIFSENGYFFDGFDYNDYDVRSVKYWNELFNRYYSGFDAIAYAGWYAIEVYEPSHGYYKTSNFDPPTDIEGMEKIYDKGYIYKFDIDGDEVCIRAYVEDGVESDMGCYKVEFIDDDTINFYYDDEEEPPLCLHRVKEAYPSSDTYFKGDWSSRTAYYSAANTEWISVGEYHFSDTDHSYSCNFDTYRVNEYVVDEEADSNGSGSGDWSYVGNVLEFKITEDGYIYTQQSDVLKISDNCLMAFDGEDYDHVYILVRES